MPFPVAFVDEITDLDAQAHVPKKLILAGAHGLRFIKPVDSPIAQKRIRSIHNKIISRLDAAASSDKIPPIKETVVSEWYFKGIPCVALHFVIEKGESLQQHDFFKLCDKLALEMDEDVNIQDAYGEEKNNNLVFTIATTYMAYPEKVVTKIVSNGIRSPTATEFSVFASYPNATTLNVGFIDVERYKLLSVDAPQGIKYSSQVSIADTKWFKNNGIGYKLYAAAICEATKRGWTLIPNEAGTGTTSEDAQHMWNNFLYKHFPVWEKGVYDPKCLQS